MSFCAKPVILTYSVSNKTSLGPAKNTETDRNHPCYFLAHLEKQNDYPDFKLAKASYNLQSSALQAFSEHLTRTNKSMERQSMCQATSRCVCMYAYTYTRPFP